MVTVEMGNKKAKFMSIKAAAKAAGMKYITYYQRLRYGVHPRTAAIRPVRKYRKGD